MKILNFFLEISRILWNLEIFENFEILWNLGKYIDKSCIARMFLKININY
jgi:hypothetical protein